MPVLVSFLCVKTYLWIAALFLHSTIISSNGFGRSRFFVRSIYGLQSLATFEPQIVTSLRKSLETAGSLPEDSGIRRKVEIFLRDFKDGYLSTEGKDAIAEQYIEASKSPICAFRLIYRVVFLLQDAVSQNDFSKYFGDLFRTIKDFSTQNGWPELEDVEDTVASILRLQHFYNLDAEKFANGLVHTIQTNCTLSSVHCYEISRAALKLGQFSYAIEWAELAKEKSLVDKLLDFSLVDNSLRLFIAKHNYALQSSQGEEPEPYLFDRRITNEPQDSKKAKNGRVSLYETFKGRKGPQFADINFWGVCAGDNFQKATERSNLFCWCESKIHPSFAIGPIKMEFLNINPDVVQMYEVIHESEIQSIISEGRANMEDSRVCDEDSGDRCEEYRTSLTGFYNDVKVTAIPRKVERLTGLNLALVTASEMLQVTAHSFGGYCGPHPDSFPYITDTVKDTGGDRIATLFFYLNDVELGGSTAFTSAGFSVKPVKGSVLFWYSLFSDGEPDYDAYHGGCPVLIGQKWVSNKWILEGDQFLVRKCGLKPKERFRIPVNGLPHTI